MTLEITKSSIKVINWDHELLRYYEAYTPYSLEKILQEDGNPFKHYPTYGVIFRRLVQAEKWEDIEIMVKFWACSVYPSWRMRDELYILYSDKQYNFLRKLLSIIAPYLSAHPNIQEMYKEFANS